MRPLRTLKAATRQRIERRRRKRSIKLGIKRHRVWSAGGPVIADQRNGYPVLRDDVIEARRLGYIRPGWDPEAEQVRIGIR